MLGVPRISGLRTRWREPPAPKARKSRTHQRPSESLGGQGSGPRLLGNGDLIKRAHPHRDLLVVAVWNRKAVADLNPAAAFFASGLR
jgi:hypothetical protein